VLAKAPLNEPTAVRAAPTMTMSDRAMLISCCKRDFCPSALARRPP
jgi:hypothetical protein